MNESQYASATELCKRLSGRLPDDYVGAARGFFGGGEPYLAAGALLGGLLFIEGNGITSGEVDLFRDLLDVAEISESELDAVERIDTPPALEYEFFREPPEGGSVPLYANEVVASVAAPYVCIWIGRVWRVPVRKTQNPATWLYLVKIAEGGDELCCYSSIESKLWTELNAKWLVEVFTDGDNLPAYQAAALAAAHPGEA